MATHWIQRRIHPRGTVNRFGTFEVAVFDSEFWSAIEPRGRADRAGVQRRPTVYGLLDQPQDAWIFSSVSTFDPATVRAAVDALDRSFRASVRGGAVGLDQPHVVPFGSIFTHELWPAIAPSSERRLPPLPRVDPDQPQTGFQWNFWPAMDVQGGSVRPTRVSHVWDGRRYPGRKLAGGPAPSEVAFDPLTARAALDFQSGSFLLQVSPIRLRLDQPESGFRFGATYSQELWPGVETHAERVPGPRPWRVVDQPSFTQDFPFDPIYARAVFDFMAASFRVDPQRFWRVTDQPSFTQDFPFDPQFTVAALASLARSFRSQPPRRLVETDQTGPFWPPTFEAGQGFAAFFWPAIAQLLQWERQTRISHVWDTRRFPGRKLVGGIISPAIEPEFSLLWAAYDFLAGSFRTRARPDPRTKDYKLAFGLLDARVVMPAIRLLVESFQSRARVRGYPSDQLAWAQVFPFDPMLTVASTHTLSASFRAGPRPSWRVWDTPADAWVFSVPSTFELAFLSAIRFLAASYRAKARPDWRAGDVADTAWTWQSDPRLLWAAYQSLLDVYRTDPRPTWRVIDQPSDAWLASPFNPALWPAIEPRWTPLDLRRRIWLPTEQPSWTQFDFPFDPPFITAALDALWRSFRADPRRIWLPTDEPLPAWIFENIPSAAPFDPAVFPWSVLGEWLRQRAGMPRESERMEEPGFPRPLFPRKPTPRRRPRC